MAHMIERFSPEKVALILPALNEEASLPGTLRGFQGQGIFEIIVADNGSTDRTASVAAAHGARVVSAPRRGYGEACLTGIAALSPQVTIVAFADADGTDAPEEFARLIEPIVQGQADMVLGSRIQGTREAGALTPQQHFGNVLSTGLMRLLIGARYSDLGPYRAIRRSALDVLGMKDTNYGWTIEMQIKAHKKGLRIREVPTAYRKRTAGESKISGTLRGTILAGSKIIWTIMKYW